MSERQCGLIEGHAYSVLLLPVIHWNLRIKDILGPATLSFVETEFVLFTEVQIVLAL